MDGAVNNFRNLIVNTNRDERNSPSVGKLLGDAWQCTTCYFVNPQRVQRCQLNCGGVRDQGQRPERR